MAHHVAPQGSPDPSNPYPHRMPMTSPEAPATRETAHRPAHKPLSTGSRRIHVRTPSRLYNGIFANHFFCRFSQEKSQCRAPGARAAPGSKEAAPQCGLARFGGLTWRARFARGCLLPLTAPPARRALRARAIDAPATWLRAGLPHTGAPPFRAKLAKPDGKFSKFGAFSTSRGCLGGV